MTEFSMDMFRLDGKVVSVTGAACGTGFEIARPLATAGAKIVFNNLNQESVDEGIAHHKEAGIDAKGYICDVTDEEAVQAMIQQIKEGAGSVDILVNNAGVIKWIPIIGMDAADFRQVIDVDLNVPFIVSKAVIPDMIEKGGGKIINICSTMSGLGCEAVSAYAVVKGGLKMLTKDITSEYGQYNIQCNGIGPGYIATPQATPLCETRENGERHPFGQFIVGHTPVTRWGELIDLAGSSVFSAPNASGSVNGYTLYIDGGVFAYIGKQP